MAGMADAPRLYRGVKTALHPVVNRYLRLTVDGIGNIPSDRAVILASNHLSFIDSLVIPINLDRPVYYLGKSDYWDNWRIRWFFEGLGVVPVRREGGTAGMASLETGIEILSRGDIVGIYPEGTRSPDGRLYRGKTGPARMALAAGVDVIPVAVIGTDRAQPTGKYMVKRQPVTVRFGRPLDLSRHAAGIADPFTLRAATDEIMYEIMLLSGQEYVDEYAAKVKSGEVAPPASDARTPLDLTRHGEDVRKAS